MIMYALPHYITTPMHQCMIIFICMFMVFDEPEIYGRHYMQIVTHPE